MIASNKIILFCDYIYAEGEELQSLFEEAAILNDLRKDSMSIGNQHCASKDRESMIIAGMRCTNMAQMFDERGGGFSDKK